MIILAGCGHLAALVANSGTAVGSWALVPPLLLVGPGMGTCFGTVYDVTIGDIEPAEAGSASGSLNAVQQLANAMGAAAVTTVYIAAVGAGAAHALLVSLGVVGAAVALCLCLERLLPRAAPAEQGH